MKGCTQRYWLAWQGPHRDAHQVRSSDVWGIATSLHSLAPRTRRRSCVLNLGPQLLDGAVGRAIWQRGLEAFLHVAGTGVKLL